MTSWICSSLQAAMLPCDNDCEVLGQTARKDALCGRLHDLWSPSMPSSLEGVRNHVAWRLQPEQS